MILHVEIPVTDLERAISFYRFVFTTEIGEVVDLHGSRMAHFPFADGQDSASVALAEGDVYKPSHNGPVVYFGVGDIRAVIERAMQMGSAMLFPVTEAGNGILVAEIEDSEGNRVALQQTL